MSDAQWTAVQRLMAGILPEWSGTDLKQRSTQHQIVVRQLWHVAEAGAEYLQEWKLQSAAGIEWLRQREASTGWLRLVLRAWREEVERHGGRDGRALPQHRRRVLWAGDNLRAALVRNRRSFHANIGSSSRDPPPSCERSKREREATFPNFDCTEAAEHVHRRIRATTTYMRVTHSAREETKRAEKRRAEERHAAEREAKRVAGEQQATSRQRARSSKQATTHADGGQRPIFWLRTLGDVVLEDRPLAAAIRRDGDGLAPPRCHWCGAAASSTAPQKGVRRWPRAGALP